MKQKFERMTYDKSITLTLWQNGKKEFSLSPHLDILSMQSLPAGGTRVIHIDGCCYWVKESMEEIERIIDEKIKVEYS